jgi:hypothetical protein
MKVEHNVLSKCNTKVIKRVRFWNKYIRNVEIERHLEERLDQKVLEIGLYCNGATLLRRHNGLIKRNPLLMAMRTRENLSVCV